MAALSQLRGSEAHSTVILSANDSKVLGKLGMNLSCDAAYESHKLYHPN